MLLRLCAALWFVSVTACVDTTSSGSQASSDPTADHGSCRPPDEAFAACANASAGDTCAFDIGGHHVDGTCKSGPDGNGPLACAPNLPPPPPPPQEAIDACASATAGDTCAFDLDGHHVDGTCRNGPDGGGPLACAPDQPPPPPPPPQQAVDACASSSAGDTCAFDIDGHHIDGTCRTAPDGSGPLACAPDLPPPPPPGGMCPPPPPP